MSREILFRGKRIDNGEWIEGFYFEANEKHMILNFTVQKNELYHNMYEIEPNTVCQYTGLTDKNGNRIWENDFLTCRKYIGGNFVDEHIECGFIEMKHGAFGIHRKNPNAYYRPFKDWLEDYEYEVIGNVFDNPELLEKRNEES